MTTLPRLPDGRVSWKDLIGTLSPGDTITLPRKHRHTAPSQLARMGIRVKSRATATTVAITILGNRSDPQPEVASAPTPPCSKTYAMAQLVNQIQSTKQAIDAWTEKARLRENHQAHVEAGARVLLYQSQLRVLRAKLADLQSPSDH